jgi:DNA-binding response OmpR family regulator
LQRPVERQGRPLTRWRPTNAALRRGDEGEDAPVVETADFSVDLAARQVRSSGGEPIRLTPTEWHLLEVLVRHEGKLVERRALLQEVWGPAYETETNYLRVTWRSCAASSSRIRPIPGT